MKFIPIYYLLFALHFLFSYFLAPNFEITFLNVGQGDAIFIKSKHSVSMVDGGPDYSLDYSIDNKIPFFICNFDFLVATHPHKDHVFGLTRILQRCSSEYVFVNQVDYESKVWVDFISLAEKKTQLTNFPTVPRVLSKGYSATFYALKPAACTADVNQCSLILELQVPNTANSTKTTILLTGDTNASNLHALYKGEVDILKVPHHGGVNSLSAALLKDYKPDIAVLSYGLGNSYGHPVLATVSELKQFGIQALHTANADVSIVVE